MSKKFNNHRYYNKDNDKYMMDSENNKAARAELQTIIGSSAIRPQTISDYETQPRTHNESNGSDNKKPSGDRDNHHVTRDTRDSRDRNRDHNRSHYGPKFNKDTDNGKGDSPCYTEELSVLI